MKYRSFRGTGVRVSGGGSGLWTVPTGWLGGCADDGALVLMRPALHRGMEGTMKLQNEDAPGRVAAN